MADVLGSLGFTQDLPDDSAELDDFHLLSNALRNERNTQDILEYKHDLVERVQRRLQEQADRVDTWKEAGKNQYDDVDMSLPILCSTLNVNRFRFLLKAYWRARLQKIERFATLILDKQELQRHCSPQELSHCLQYFVAVGKCLKEVVLAKLPEEFQTLVQESQLTEARDMIPAPRLDRCVFIKLLKDAGHVAVDAEGTQLVDMKAGDIYIIQYSLVQRLVQQDIAVLI
ncbi:hypothetical protein CHLRE_09g393600v5 [Chlamydomonas reinhardtii]|uniref:DNA replication complex GINS protein SLD5 n=1 Tax=Chlamydomonas reinhardtii TaxID=3055 RepID=A0A2K3DDC1_CHLRE|nr:uncharacterized protein CHLRE_09g393600v5 [Chlamydomonas reinhardtii]PNW78528.1 hypothetical protein CHLRE_09g393600v5 [Chlamydomonas reinhardtii]